MKKPDLESTLVAGAAGMVLLPLFLRIFGGASISDSGPAGPMSTAVTGFAVGAGVQVGVRVLGVS